MTTSAAVSSGDWISGDKFLFKGSPAGRRIALKGGCVRSPINTRRRTIFLGNAKPTSPTEKAARSSSLSPEKHKTKSISSSKFYKSSTKTTKTTAIKEAPKTKVVLSRLSSLLEGITSDEVMNEKPPAAKASKKSSQSTSQAATTKAATRRRSVLAKTETNIIPRSPIKKKPGRKPSANSTKAAGKAAWRKSLPTNAVMPTVQPVQEVVQDMIAIVEEKISRPKKAEASPVKKSAPIPESVSKVEITPASKPTPSVPKSRKSDWATSLPSNAILPASKPSVKTPSPIKAPKVSKSVAKPASKKSTGTSISPIRSVSRSVRKTRYSVAANLTSPVDMPTMTSESRSTVTVAADGSPILAASKSVAKIKKSSDSKSVMKAAKTPVSKRTSSANVLPTSTPVIKPSELKKENPVKSPTSTPSRAAKSDAVSKVTPSRNKLASESPRKLTPSRAKMSAETQTVKKKQLQTTNGVNTPPRAVITTRQTKSVRKSAATSTTDVLDGGYSPDLKQSTRKRKSLPALSQLPVKKSLRLRQTPTRYSAAHFTPARDLRRGAEPVFFTPDADDHIQSTAGHTPYQNPLASAAIRRQATPYQAMKQAVIALDETQDGEEEYCDASTMEDHPITNAASSKSWCSIM